MLKVLKFGGSSLADARQFAKVKSIVEADPARRVVIVSAPGKRFSGDHKITDLLYLCAAHIKYGVSCEDIFAMIRDRYNEIIAECGLHISLDKEFDALWDKMKNGISQDELASRGEYFSARLMAEYLGYEFVDAARWIKFKFDGTVDQDASYAALRSLAEDRKVVIPGFYGVMPDGHIRTFSRGGSDITGALELSKISRSVKKASPEASLEVLLVLDAITGQNAISQAEEFCKAANATGVVLTKLDGTPRGGCAVSVWENLGLPIRFIGVGEKIDDLMEFDAQTFVESLLPESALQKDGKKEEGESEA